jgi:hypothetical protein
MMDNTQRKPGFTPGPWRAVLGDYGMAYNQAYVNVDDGADRVASVWCSREGYEANAHLIAAAPELYEALEKIAKADPVDLALDPNWPQRIACAALSRANGGEK